jgi:hypothetical protein
VSNAWSNVAAFVPKFAVFLLILVVGYLIAKAIAKILSKVLTRVGFDRLVERGGVKRALDRSSYDASGILAKVVYYAIMLFVLSTAFGVFGSNPISDYLRAVIGYLPLAFVVLAATLSAHRSAAFGVYVLAALGGDDAADGRSSGCAVAGVVAVEEAGKHVDEFEQQRVDLGLLVSGVLGAVAGDEPVPSGGCLLFVLGGVVPGLVAGLPPAQGFGPVHGAGWCW